jgi:hypothetical protein
MGCKGSRVQISASRPIKSASYQRQLVPINCSGYQEGYQQNPDTLPGATALLFFVCQAIEHCGSRRPRLLSEGFTDRHEAQAALEALSDEHPHAYLLPIRVIQTDQEPPRVRSMTFEEARALRMVTP